MSSRHAVCELATQLGIITPCFTRLQHKDDLERLSHPFPWVLKTSGSWGGNGVCIVENHAAARSALQSLLRPVSSVIALKRWLVNRDPFSLPLWLQGCVPEVIAQRYIPGCPANIAVACWRGQVIGALSVKALRTQGPTGASMIVQVIDSSDMLEAARRLVSALGLSGLHGLDFIIDNDGRPWLIELNPRATQICHIAQDDGFSLAARLGAQLTNRELDERPPAPIGATLALFPQAWNGMPGDPLLATAAHDVPWEEPGLLRDLIQPPWPNRSWLARGWQRLARPDLRHPWTEVASSLTPTMNWRRRTTEATGGN